MSNARNTPPDSGKRLPGKPHHWLFAAVLFVLLILWMVSAAAAPMFAREAGASVRQSFRASTQSVSRLAESVHHAR